jgi:hypothetical protein
VSKENAGISTFVDAGVSEKSTEEPVNK